MNAEKAIDIKIENIIESTFHIRDLDCPDCALKVEKSVGKLKGVESSIINFSTAKLTVNHLSGREEAILEELNKIGHPGDLEVSGRIINDDKTLWYLNSKAIMTLISGIFFSVGLIMDLLSINPQYNQLLYVLAIVIGGYSIAKRGLYALKALSLDMNSLMLIAVIGAGILGEWVEGAAVVFLFSLGNTLQAYTMDKTRKSIRKLMELAPNTALIKTADGEKIVSLGELKIKDTVIVKPGERIPIDGKVLKGSSEVNQAAITGESIPLSKNPGDEVFAGTINENGLLQIEVTKIAEDTTLAKIMNLVEEAQNQKAPMEQWVDKFAKYYTPMVVVIAIFITLVPPLVLGLPLEIWFKRALILLVIACPCALVISTPVSIVAAIGNASKQGVLIKGGVYLEEFGRVKAIAFDKTGTLTIGKPVILETIPINCNNINPLQIAANIEMGSKHPIAKAFIAKAIEEEISLYYEIEESKTIPGKGVIAVIEGVKFFLGNEALLRDNGIEADYNNIEGNGNSLVYLANSEGILAKFTISDRARDESKNLAKQLEDLGIENLYMLTGDNISAAKTIAEEIGFKNYIGELLPEDKLNEIRKLLDKHSRVVMVGDGINDTPSLSLATVGVAMGAAGTDAALETADIALMGDDLNKLAYTVALGRKTLKVIKENIVFSLFIKLIFIALTLIGLSNLWMAVFADTGAALIVILNSMRLLKFKY